MTFYRGGKEILSATYGMSHNYFIQRKSRTFFQFSLNFFKAQFVVNKFLIPFKQTTIYELLWTFNDNVTFEHCFNIDKFQWFNGLNIKLRPGKENNVSIIHKVDVTKINIREDYWLSALGINFVLKDDVKMILKTNKNSIQMCLRNRYPTITNNSLYVFYSLKISTNPIDMYQYDSIIYFEHASSKPDFGLFEFPLYPAIYLLKNYTINQKSIVELATRIVDYGFGRSYIEIDNWEKNTGCFDIDTDKYPSFWTMKEELKNSGFGLTLMIYPYAQINCPLNIFEVINNRNLRLKNDKLENVNNEIILIDFTNDSLSNLWLEKLKKFSQEYGIDSFKCSVEQRKTTIKIRYSKSIRKIHQKFIQTCATFGSKIIVPFGYKTHDLPNLFMMPKLQISWSPDDGLPSLIPTLLRLSLNGLAYMVPDSVPSSNAPSKELYIRWFQASTFLPSLRFFYPPWNYDEETVKIIRHYTQIHTIYSEDIIKAFDVALDGWLPSYVPVWWNDKNDDEAKKITDEFLIGDILVAPVIEEGATQRDIYLPSGHWATFNNSEIIYHRGPKWLRNYQVPLSELPYFVKEKCIP